MKLGDFILARTEPILVEWQAFAATLLPAAGRLDGSELRDHAKAMLEAIAQDLARDQSTEASVLKSKGLAPDVEGAPRTAAQTHAILRARDGFDINQMAAEYRALRASVLRLWLAEGASALDDVQDVIRFNEAIDQALAESVSEFSLAVQKGRNLLMGMLGHDMRNPLSVIVTTSHYLTLLDAEDRVSVAADRLMRSGARIQALVDDLVDFSRTQLGLGIHIVASRVDLARVFRDEVDLQCAAHPGRQVSLAVSGDTVGHWDGHRIHQALGNLVGNALKYGSQDAPVQVVLAGHADKVCFSIENRGDAIPATFIDEMFAPLARGTRESEGTAAHDGSLGLGLYITREIVKAHDGDITVRSDAVRTVFDVELPRPPAAPPPAH